MRKVKTICDNRLNCYEQAEGEIPENWFSVFDDKASKEYDFCSATCVSQFILENYK